MAAKLGPKIVNDGLVLCLDAADANSYAGEPTTNVLQYPESINSGPTKESWSGTITQNAVTAPDGTLTATKIEATSGYVYERLYINTSYNGVSFGVGDTITYSVWIKMLDGTETTSNGPYIWNYNNPTYGIVARDLSGLGPDWKLYKITYTIQSHQTNFAISYSGSNGGVTGTYAIWHPQLEVKTYNTPYVETSRSATDGWVDLSGNSNSGNLINGTNTGVSHYRDGQVIKPINNAYLDFDGSNDYLSIPQFDFTSTHSLEWWFNTDNLTEKYSGGGGYAGHMLCWGHSPSERIYLKTNGGITIYIHDSSSGASFDTSNFSVTAGEWTHITATLDWISKSVKFYQNGVLKDTIDISSMGSWNYTGASNPYDYIDFGRNINNNNVFYDGKLASIKIYNKILTAAEVLSNYNATKGRFSL